MILFHVCDITSIGVYEEGTNKSTMIGKMSLQKYQ